MFFRFLDYLKSKDGDSVLVPNRVIFMSEEKPYLIQNIPTKYPNSEVMAEKVEKAKKDLEANKIKVENAIADYNKKYAATRFFREPKHFEKPYVGFLDDPSASIKKLYEILNTPYEIKGNMYTLAEMAPSQETSTQPADIKELIKLFEDRKKLIETLELAKKGQLDSDKRGLVYMARDIEKRDEVMHDWENRDEYKNLRKDYDDEMKAFLKAPEYKRFFQKPDGSIDPQLERENRKLFFSILAKETGNFKTDFVFSKFSSGSSEKDIEENKKNYPFIYYEWLTKIERFDPSNINRSKDAADAKKKEIESQNLRTIGQGVLDLNTFIGKKRDLKKRISLFANPLDKLGKEEETLEWYTKEKNALTDFKNKDINNAITELSSDDATDKELLGKLKEFEKELDQRIELSGLKLAYYNEVERKKTIDKKFTKAYFSDPDNRQMVMQLALRQYIKALTIADTPFGNAGSFQPLIHPAVRRTLIATIYREGVVRHNPEDPTGKPIEGVGNEYKWMLEKLGSSQYFNRAHKEKYLDPQAQVEFLIVLRLGNFSVFSKEHMEKNIIPALESRKPILDRLKTNIAEEKTAADPKRKTELNTLINNDIREIQRFTLEKVTRDNAWKILDTEKTRIVKWDAFLAKVEELVNDPTDPAEMKDDKWKDKKRDKIRAFLRNLNGDPTFKEIGQSNQTILEQYSREMQEISVTYESLDRKEKQGNFLETMGIVPTDLYLAYQDYIKRKGDKMKSDNWDNLFATREGVQKLLEMFREILPKSNVFKGREQFLNVFATLGGPGFKVSPDLHEAGGVAINIFRALKIEIDLREKQSGKEESSRVAAMAKIDGMTFGEKATGYAKGVIDMLIGPGQTIANRAAGAVMLLMFWKAAKTAWKGEGKFGTAMRMLFIAGAAELTLKKLTGKGILDKFKLDGVAKAMEGTYGSVLIDRAKDRFKQKDLDIADEEHANALFQLRNAPFADVMKWYRETDDNGQSRPGKKTKLPRQIDTSNIVGGTVQLADEDRESRARLIIKETIKNFFGYVGNKEEKDETWGREVLDEVWIKSVQDKDFNLKKAKYTKRMKPDWLLKSLRERPSSVTWQMVMESEIRSEDVKRVTQQDPLDRLKDYIIENGAALASWSRRSIEQKLGVGADRFWENVKGEYIPKITNFLSEMGEKGARNLRYFADRAELWYDNHRIEIRRIGRQHWEIVKEGIKLPFQVLYAADQWIVPYVATKLRQTREILRPDKLIPLSGDLTRENIEPTLTPEDYRQGKSSLTTKEHAYFGNYAPHFANAFDNNDKFEIDRVGQIGYYISEVNQEDSGVRKEDDTSLRLEKMQNKSGEKALEEYHGRYPELTRKEIENVMYPIHMYSKPGGGEKPPEKMYVFWRMPLPKSAEYQLKADKRWADSENPNDHKFRLPFYVHPEWTILKNMYHAYGLDNPALRTAGDKLTSTAIAQSLRLYANMIETLGGAAATISRFWRTPEEANLIKEMVKMSEATKQKIDERLGSAGNTALALSHFYRNPDNAKKYQDELDAAIEQTRPMHLGGLEGWVPVTYKKFDDKGVEVDEPVPGRLNPQDFFNPPKEEPTAQPQPQPNP